MFFQVLFLFYFIATSIGDVSKNETNTTKLNPALSVTKNTTIPKFKTNPAQVSEGGGSTINVNHVDGKNTTHMGREHVIINDNSRNIGENVTKPDSSEIIFETPEKNDNKKSVPKKGVTIPIDDNISITTTTTTTTTRTTTATTKTTTTTTTTTTPKPIKKKPLITEAGDEIPFAPSNFNPKITNNETNNNNRIPNDHGDKVREADYIVPIVAVILSVPLVAIILSVLYKRGAEWWQHRHYRRMDFLIEGMYNN